MNRTTLSALSVALTGLCLNAFAGTVTPKIEDALSPLPPAKVKFSGWLGQQLETCREGRMLKQSIPDLVNPFKERNETRFWQSEFWGKWFTSAALSWRYAGDPGEKARLDEAVAGLLATQTPDGYIGNYTPEAQTKQWDIWGRKYVMLGLLAYHDLTGDAKALAAAVREADFTIQELQSKNLNIVACGNWTGMAASSILEPMVLLYRRTGEPRFLAFAQDIVARWETPPGPDLLRKALAGTTVYDMFPGPDASQKGYMSGGQSKAYEMMSCYEGLLELHRITGEPDYATAVKKVAATIRDTEITIIGSGSSWERWCRGSTRQTEDVKEWMETCVGATWIKLNAQLLRLTGDPSYAEAIEQTAYNSLPAAQKPDGTWWCHYNPLEGSRSPAPEQCKMHMNCCVASGPRALMLLPALAVMSSKEGPVVNFYEAATADTGTAKLQIGGNYPREGAVSITVTPAAASEFTLRLRIPAWSRQTKVFINGQSSPEPQPGTYLRLHRTWQPGDKVDLQFDLTTHLENNPGGTPHVAVVRGPVVMVLDKRFTQPQPGLTSVVLATDASAPIPASLVTGPLPAPAHVVLDVAVKAADGRSGTLRMCDYASSGKTWDAASEFRVWLPQPLNLAEPFAGIRPSAEQH